MKMLPKQDLVRTAAALAVPQMTPAVYRKAQ